MSEEATATAQREMEMLRMHVRMLETQIADMQFGAEGTPTAQPPWQGDMRGGAVFSGRLYIATLPKIIIDEGIAGATRFLKVYLNPEHSPHYKWVEAMPDRMDSDSVVYDLDETFGDIHLIGQFAG